MGSSDTGLSSTCEEQTPDNLSADFLLRGTIHMHGQSASKISMTEDSNARPSASHLMVADPVALDDLHSLCREPVWKEIIEKSFGHKAMFQTVEKDGRIVESIPFFLVRGMLRDWRLIAPPYQGFDGGFTCPDTHVRQDLIKKIIEVGKEKKVQYIEIRTLSHSPELTDAGFVETTPLLISEVPLQSEAANWNLLGATHRRNVKMAARKGVRIEQASQWRDMEDFYAQLSVHYKRLGVPFLGKAFFHHIWNRVLGEGKGFLLIARRDKENIGGLLALHSGKTLIGKYSVARTEARYAHVNASYALFWEAIRRGAESGFTTLNMGITGEDNQGLRDFKLRFGAVEKPAFFYYYPIRGKIPDYKKLYGSYHLLKLGWSLMPMPLARGLGSLINRWIC